MSTYTPMKLCANCDHFRRQYADRGDCRAHPPKSTTDSLTTKWPAVTESDWCGEFQPRPDGEREGK